MTARTKTVLRLIFAFGFAFCGALAFSTDISVSTFSKHSNITLADNTLLWSVLTAALTYFYMRVMELPPKKRSDKIVIGILSVLFGFLNVIGHSLYYLDSWDFLFGNAYQLILGSVCALGYAALFYACARAGFCLLDHVSLTKAEDADRTCFVQRHPRLFPALVIAVVLLLWLVVYFPGYTNNDINYQLRQFFGYDAMTNSHPVLCTLIMGICMRIGKLIGSDAAGLFLYMFLQASLFTVAFSAVCETAFKKHLPKVLRIVILLFYALLPVWGAYSVQGMKDGLFASVFTLFVLYCLRFGETIATEKKENVRFYIAFGFVSILAALLRSMMQYAVGACLLAAAILSVVHKKERGKMILTAVAGAAVSFGFIYVLLPMIGVIKCNNTESLSIPFQQVARIVREHPEETESEREVIDSVLDYDALKEVYMPVLSDPVKDTYHIREDADEQKKLDAFLSVWKKLVTKYPADALQATMANTFGYFSFTPSIQTQNGHTGMCFFLSDDNNKGKVETETYSISYPKALATVRKAVLTLAYLYDALPVFNLLYACAFYFWGIILLFAYLLSRSGFTFGVTAIAPLLLQIGCLGSSVNDCFRYEAPLAAAFPVLLIAACLASSKSNRSPVDQ